MAATRADVARHANVSPAVVSYVLNPGMRPVSPATRDRVLAAVEELDYRPNAVAQALRRNSTHSVGLLLPDYRNPFFVALLQSLENAALDADRVLVVGSAGDGLHRRDQYIRTFLDRKVDGLIIASRAAWEATAAARGRASASLPTVVLDRLPDGAAASSVIADEREGMRIATRHLIESGARHIGLVTGHAQDAERDHRLLGWSDALREAGRDPEEGLVARAVYETGPARAAFGALLDREPRIDAVAVASDVQALSVLAEAYARGIRIPDDLAVVAFDGTDVSATSAPALTVVRQPLDEMARTAMQLVLAVPDQPVHEVLPPELVVRDSTRPAAR